ncbi:hypothetical protein [Streptomyces sp. E-08]|uniref:hypothetical protein n=1 Tax=Streptomyces sp. E-08 TaxID=3404047 RepID=UPI003CF8689E
MTANLQHLTSIDDYDLGAMATPWGDFTDSYATVEDVVAAAPEAGGAPPRPPAQSCSATERAGRAGSGRF